MGKSEDWRVLVWAGLVLAVIGMLAGDPAGAALLVVGLSGVVAGGAWRALRRPGHTPTRPK